MIRTESTGLEDGRVSFYHTADHLVISVWDEANNIWRVTLKLTPSELQLHAGLVDLTRRARVERTNPCTQPTDDIPAGSSADVVFRGGNS